MTTSGVKPCSNIPEPLNLAIEVNFITRQILFGHRAYLASHHKSNAATEDAIRLFGLHTLAAPQVFYRESSSQIERAGGLELPLGTRSAASQHGGPVSPFELVTAQLRHDVLRRDPQQGDGPRPPENHLLNRT